MKNYLYHIQLFFCRFAVVLLAFSISRLIFYLFNIDYFDNINNLELIKIFVSGIRFDISALFYFNLLFILLSLIPGNFKNKRPYQTIVFSIFLIVNSVLLATNFIDTKFFDFQHARLTFNIFSSVWLGEDFVTLLPQFIFDFWYLIVIWIISIILLFKFYPRFKYNTYQTQPLKIKALFYQSILFIVLLLVGLVGGRGGLQLKPLRVIHATKYTSSKNIPLVLNSPFTIMKTIGSKSFEPNKYFTSEQLDSIYSPLQKPANQIQKKSPNIVLIIMESFSKEYIGALTGKKGYTPFLDSLITKSLVFPNSFANGKRSIEAMPSIISGLPALTEEAYITSSFSTNTIHSIPNQLKKEGYYTAFFHGGKNGTMGFDQFAQIAGFDNYFGMNEYPTTYDYDGRWGVYDEPYLNYFGNTLNRFQEPFFASVFTLTSHHPYKIPEKYKGKFPKGTLNIHESIGYTDYSLRQFFESIKDKNWYNNTLFILTADHTAQAESPFYKNKIGNYAIPLLFFHPNDSTFMGQSIVISQHTDIFPTIMEYLKSNQPYVCFGNSLLNDSAAHFTVNYMNGIYQLFEDGYLLQFDGNKPVGFFDIKNDSLLQQNLISNFPNINVFENKLKAIIQSYHGRIATNNLTIGPAN